MNRYYVVHAYKDGAEQGLGSFEIETHEELSDTGFMKKVQKAAEQLGDLPAGSATILNVIKLT